MKSSKSDSIKTCDVCQETMNRRDRQPVCLPSCGHSFCRSCLIRIHQVNGEVRCPSCRCVHRHPAPADLPVNWTLMDLLDPDEEEGSNSNNASAPNTEDTKEAPNSTDGVSPPEEDNLKSKQSSNSKPTKKSSYLKWCAVGAAGVVGGVGLVAAAPVVLTGVGFGSAGITAGSWAAAWMSSSAIASGGGVLAGGAVATLQSAGAVGIGAAASAALGVTGAGAGAGIGYGVTKLVEGSSNTQENSGNDSDSTSKNLKKDNDHDDNHRGQQENQENSKSSENISKCDDGKDDSDSDCILYESDDIGDKL